MTSFKFAQTVPEGYGARFTTAFGTPQTKYKTEDANKLCKLASDGNRCVVAVAGDDIEYMIVGIEGQATVNNGHAYGTAQRYFNFQEAIIKGGAITVGAQVEAADQEPLGTTQSHPYIRAGEGTLRKWRVVSLLDGGGLADTVVLIEPIKN